MHCSNYNFLFIYLILETIGLKKKSDLDMDHVIPGQGNRQERQSDIWKESVNRFKRNSPHYAADQVPNRNQDLWDEDPKPHPPIGEGPKKRIYEGLKAKLMRGEELSIKQKTAYKLLALHFKEDDITNVGVGNLNHFSNLGRQRSHADRKDEDFNLEEAGRHNQKNKLELERLEKDSDIEQEEVKDLFEEQLNLKEAVRGVGGGIAMGDGPADENGLELHRKEVQEMEAVKKLRGMEGGKERAYPLQAPVPDDDNDGRHNMAYVHVNERVKEGDGQVEGAREVDVEGEEEDQVPGEGEDDEDADAVADYIAGRVDDQNGVKQVDDQDDIDQVCSVTLLLVYLLNFTFLISYYNCLNSSLTLQTTLCKHSVPK